MMETLGDYMRRQEGVIGSALNPNREGGEMSEAAQAEVEFVTGPIQGIIAKPGEKWQVEVNTGQQNPRRLWTKDASLVAQLNQMIGQTLTFNCGISHWVNNSGQPVRSLWINGVGQPTGVPAVAATPAVPLPGQLPPQAAPPPIAAPQAMPIPPQAPVPVAQPVVRQGITEEQREGRIMRQTASKVAGIMLTHLQPEQRTLDSIITLSERLVAYYMYGSSVQAQANTPPPGDPEWGDQGEAWPPQG